MHARFSAATQASQHPPELPRPGARLAESLEREGPPLSRVPSRASRRTFLGWSAAVSVPLLAGCEQGELVRAPVPVPTPPQQPPRIQIVERPVEIVVTREVEREVTREVPVTVVVTATPLSRAPVRGTLQVVQQANHHASQTGVIGDAMLRASAARGWPLDRTTAEPPSDDAGLIARLQARRAAGDPPDLVIDGLDSLPLWEQRLIAPVDDLVSWATREYGQPVARQRINHLIDGRWFAVPYWVSAGGYWARKSWLEEASIDPTRTYDLQQWAEHARRISSVERRRWGWGNTVARSSDGTRNVAAAIFGAGGRFTNERNEVVFRSADTIAGFEWLRALHAMPATTAAMPPTIGTWNDRSNDEAFLTGTIGFTSDDGSIFATALQRGRQLAEDMILVPHPTGSAGRRETHLVAGPTTFQHHLMDSARNADAARELIQILLRQDALGAAIENGAGLSMPAYREWGWDLKGLTIAPNDVIGQMRRVILSERPFTYFQPLDQPRLWISAAHVEHVLTDTIGAILKGQAVEAAVGQTQERLVQIHRRLNGR